MKSIQNVQHHGNDFSGFEKLGVTRKTVKKKENPAQADTFALNYEKTL